MTNKISVVVASQNARHSVLQCLKALESQTVGPDEVIVVDNSTDGTIGIVEELFGSLTIIRAPGKALIPELWEIGIDQSHGDVVATTTTHFVPKQDWIEQILKAHESPYAGIGGAIDNDSSARLVPWAVYFCRYSTYMPPFHETLVNDLAADNASYKRWALERCRIARREGFWESFVHAEMRKSGLKLLLTPHILVSHQQSFTFGSFLKQRFQHGVQFGARRAEHLSSLRRVAFILAFPLVPIVLLWRIGRRVVVRRKHLAKFAFALPVLLFFLCSWCLGEVSGYLMDRHQHVGMV